MASLLDRWINTHHYTGFRDFSWQQSKCFRENSNLDRRTSAAISVNLLTSPTPNLPEKWKYDTVASPMTKNTQYMQPFTHPSPEMHGTTSTFTVNRGSENGREAVGRGGERARESSIYNQYGTHTTRSQMIMWQPATSLWTSTCKCRQKKRCNPKFTSNI